MVEVTTGDIKAEYKQLCNQFGHILTRREYRQCETLVTSDNIESFWGNWTNFVSECCGEIVVMRNKTIKMATKKKVLITSVQDGSDIDVNMLKVLKNYCKLNEDCEFFILWGRSFAKSRPFSIENFNLLKPYLATEVIFDLDPTCLAKDFLIPPTQKNPLSNLDKLSTDFRTIVVGSVKQYLQILPYKDCEKPRFACSTGTLSELDYRDTVTNQLDFKFETKGAILLELENGRYIPRNLIYKKGEIYDIDKVYSETDVKNIKDVDAFIIGDLHLPETDWEYLNGVIEFVNKIKPKEMFLHDVASWNSISHHNLHEYYTRVKNMTIETSSLENEYKAVMNGLKVLADKVLCKKINIVHSNHDEFIIKWLNTGEFIKDSINAKFGAKLFIDYLDSKDILEKELPLKYTLFPNNYKYEIKGYQLGEHGDKGISGAKGSVRTYTKAFGKTVIGHTHSPQIFENTIVVGTTSTLKVSYNQNGFTTWMHGNCIIHNNGTFQLLLK